MCSVRVGRVWARGLLLAVAALLAAPGAQPARERLLTAPNLPTAKPDFSIYHRKQDLLNEVTNVVKAHPDVMSLETRTASDANYSVTMQVVHVELGGDTTRSDSSAGPEAQKSKVRILMDFGEHGREFISSELGLSLLRLLGSPAAMKSLVGGGERGDRLTRLLHRTIFKILPMENERGRELAEAGQLCERKNGRGVDPNRNWEVDWGRKEKDYDPAEEFPGDRPFSEPETQIVLGIAREFKPHVWLNVHSGMEAMFTPWDHRGEVAPGSEDALKLLHTIRDNLFTGACVVGSGGKSVGYLAHGTATDYMYERLKVPIAYTWEIYGDMAAPYHDCFRMFNPITREQVQHIIGLWLKAILRLVELLPTHHALAAEGIFLDAEQLLPVPPASPLDATSTPAPDGQQGSSGGDGGVAGSASDATPPPRDGQQTRGTDGQGDGSQQVQGSDQVGSQGGGSGPARDTTDGVLVSSEGGGSSADVIGTTDKGVVISPLRGGPSRETSWATGLYAVTAIGLLAYGVYKWQQQRPAPSAAKTSPPQSRGGWAAV